MSVREPVDKLPLAIRKNVRDEFENNRADLESRLSKLLGGEEWKIDVNPNLLYAYAKEGSYAQQSLGACIKSYIDGAFSWLKDFIGTERHGSEGVTEINTLASTHTLTIYPDTYNKVSYCGVDIQDGVLRILFAEGNLGVNNSNAFEYLAKALSSAASPASGVLDYAARNSIKQGWDEHVEKLQKDIADQLHNPDIKLNPNFEEVAQKLKASKNASKDWSQNLGNFAKEYFASVLSWMKESKFEQDDLLYEGFNEQVTKNEIIFRIVDKVTGPSKYNQCLIDDGSLVLQTTPNYFGSNMSLIAERLVDVL